MTLFKNKSREDISDIYEETPRKVSYIYCKGCPLRGNRKVWAYRGNHNSPLCFVGMNPGTKEKESGYPFVGPAGKKFEEEVIERLSLADDYIEVDGNFFAITGQFYLTNIVKCWTANNDDPTESTIGFCWNHLRPELRGRKIIVGMGNLAQAAIRKRYKGEAAIFDMIHPSAANYKGKYHARLIQDAKDLGELLNANGILQ